MATVSLSQSDVQIAEEFLAQFLTEQVPEGQFGPGTAMRDLAVKGFAYIFAYLRKEIDNLRVRQSIARISTDGAALDDTTQALDEVLSNWFITRLSGSFASVIATFHFSRRATVSIPYTTRFWRTTSASFTVDTGGSNYVVAEHEMLPRYDSRGTLIDYVAKVPLRATQAGASGNQAPGRFVRIELQSSGVIPYLLYVENENSSTAGAEPETNDELIARANTYISVRNLINNRSCDVTLQEAFPEISEVLTVGMGEPEMQRDRRVEFSALADFHLGGHYDTYIELPNVQVDESGTVGGYYARPDGVISVFRDPALTYDAGTPFSATVGDVLYIRSGIDGVPRGFQIVEVTPHELFISEASPFPQASDEEGTTVIYSVGNLSPSFDNIIGSRTALPSVDPAYSHIPAGTSRYISEPGVLVLQGRPVQDILLVEVVDPVGIPALVDPARGTVVFQTRTNLTPSVPTTPQNTQYQVYCLNPKSGQSAYATTCINVGYSGTPGAFDGRTLKVSYLTPRGFTGVHDYATNDTVRVLAANHLIRARNPIWISMSIPYRLKPTSISTLDTAAAARTVADAVNAFDPNDDLDMSDIATVLRTAYPTIIGTVFPFVIYYSLHTPDGQVVEFSTTDIVSIFMGTTTGVTLLNGPDIVVPLELQNRGVTQISTAGNLRDWYTVLGISDRTVKYRTREDLITFVLQN